VSYFVILISFMCRDSKLIRALLSLYTTVARIFGNDGFENRWTEKIQARERRLLEKEGKDNILREYKKAVKKDDKDRKTSQKARSATDFESGDAEKRNSHSRRKGKGVDLV
jgi:hypothetical protein